MRRKFTGYERDSETDLDFAKARFYGSSLGRFTSVDPMSLKKEILANPQNLDRYVYTRNSPLTNVDRDGKCTAPSGLAKGQVGICIEAFIATPRVPGSGGRGFGDGRTFDGNNASLTSKIQVQVILSADKNGVYASPLVTKVGTSRIQVADDSEGGFAAAKIGEMKPSNVIGIPGKGSAKIGDFQTSRPQGSENFGTTTINITGTAKNGPQAIGDTLVKIPTVATIAVGEVMRNAVPGTIDFSINFKVTGSGNVEAEGVSKGYPSYAAYSYQLVNGQVQTTTLLKRPENKIEDLTKPMTPIH